MVTVESLIKIGLYSWRLKYSSDLPEPVFYIYLDGVLIAETEQTEYNIAINMEEGSVIEVLDDPDAQPMQIFPGKLRLGWFFVEGTDYYRIDEYIGSEWVERYRMPENGGYISWQSRFLEDGQTHLFRIVPIGTNGNEGTAKQFVVLMVRRPNVPDVKYTYKVADYNVSGDIYPDGTGNYFRSGTHNDEYYYRRADGEYFIWWNGSTTWYITFDLGELGSGAWSRTDPSILGGYAYLGGFSGNPGVSAGAEPGPGKITIEEN